MSAAGPGTTKAASESQVCVFCHTPHGATTADQSGAGVRAPLWNRRIPAGSTYTPYTSASLDANVIQGQLDQPGGSSKLCLSCHDGTLAIGNVNVLNGQPNATIAMVGTGAGGTMPPGAGLNTGFTRNLGVDLRNDHPISVTYTAQLANRDGELRLLDGNQRFPSGSGSVIAAGNFPLWLAPEQVRVITLNDDEALINYAKPIVAELRANMVRVEADYSATPIKAKIADAEESRVHTMLVIGPRDTEAGAVSVRLHHGGPQGAKPKAEVVADILASITGRKA